MSQEYRIAVGIDSTEAVKGSEEFDAAIDRVAEGATKVVNRVDALQESINSLGNVATSTGDRTREISSSLREVGEAAGDVTPVTERFRETLANLIENTSVSGFSAELREYAAATNAVALEFARAGESLKADAWANLSEVIDVLADGLNSTVKTIASFGDVVEEALQISPDQLVAATEEIAKFELGIVTLNTQLASGEVTALEYFDQLSGLVAGTDGLKAGLTEAKIVAASFNRELEALGEVDPQAQELQVFVTRLSERLNVLVESQTGVIDKYREQAQAAQVMAEAEEDAVARIRDMVAASIEKQEAFYRDNEAISEQIAKLRELREQTDDTSDATERMFNDQYAGNFAAYENEINAFNDALKQQAHTFEDLIERREWLADLEKDGRLANADSKEALEQIERAERNLIKSIEDHEKAAHNLLKRYDPMTAALITLERDEEALRKAYEAGTIAADAYANATENLRKKREETQSGGGAGGPPDKPPPNLVPLTGQVEKLSAGMLRLAGVAIGFGAFAKMAIDAGKLEESFLKLENVTGGTTEELSTLREEMVALGKEFGKSQVAQVAASLKITQRGFKDTAEAAKVLREANRLAVSGFTSVAKSADSLSRVMSAFSIKADDAAEAAGILSVASGGSAEKLGEMAAMTGRLGARIAQSGVSLKDFSASLATLTESGMESRRAMAGMTALVERLANVTPALTVKLREAGVEVSRGRIQAEGLSGVYRDLMVATNGNREALTRLLGSQEAATALIAIMKNEGENYNATMAKMANSSDILSDRTEKAKKTFSSLADSIKAGVQDSFLRTGEVIMQALVPAMEVLAKHTTALGIALQTLAAVFLIRTVLPKFIAFGLSAAAAITGPFSKVPVAVGGSLKAVEAATATHGTRLTALFRGFGGYLTAAIIAWGLGKAIIAALRESDEDIDKWFTDFEDRFASAFASIKEELRRANNLYSLRQEIGSIRDGSLPREEQDALIDELVQGYQNLEVAINSAAAAVTAKSEKDRYAAEITEALLEEEKIRRLELAAMGHEDMSEAYATSFESLSGPPMRAIQREIDVLKEMKAALDKDMMIDAATREKYLEGYVQKLEELQVQAAAAGRELSPMAKYLRDLAGSVNETAAATNAYDDRLRLLAQALGHGQVSHSEYERQVRLAGIALKEATGAIDPMIVAATRYATTIETIAKARADNKISERAEAEALVVAEVMYQRATRAGGEYANMLRGIKAAIDPATAALVDMQNKIAEAQLLVGKGLSYEEFQRYEERVTSSAQHTIAAMRLQQDSVIGLVAEYDPLIRAEMDRELALLKLRAQVDLLAASEAEREVIYADMARVIDENFEKTKRALDDNIDMAKVWEEAWKQTIARVDGAFVDLWESAFSGFESFADQLKTSFKRLMAELAHARFTKPLLEQFAGMFGNIKEKAPSASAQVREMAMEDLKKRTGIGGSTGPLTKKDTTEAVYDALVRFEREKELGNMLHGGSAGGVQLGSLSSAIGDLNSTYAEGSKVLEKFGVKIQNPFEGMDFDLPSILVGGGESGSGGGTATEAARAVQEAISGKSGSGGIMGQIGNLMSAFKLNLGNFGASFSTMFKGFLQGNYMSGSQLGTAMQSGASGYGAVAGQVVAGAGIGYLSGSVVNSVLGDRGKSSTTDALSAIGGAIGSIWGPLGAIIGGAIGSFASNLIGGGKKIMDKGYELTVQSGALIGQEYEKIKKYGSFFSSKTIMKRSDMDDELFNAINAQFKESSNFLKDVAKSLDLSTKAIEEFSAATIKISTKGKKKTPEQIQAEIEQQLINIAGKQIDTFLSQTEGVTDRFRAMVDMFRPAGSALSGFSLALFNFATGTKAYTKEFIEAFRLVSVLEKGFQMVPDVEADKLIAEANKTQTQKYLDLADAAVEASREFDGSIESLAKVTEAFMIQREAAVLLAVELKKAAEEITGMFTDTAQSIRESLMTDEELYNYRKRLVEQSAVDIEQTTDPGELRRLSNIINSTINELYRSFDDTQKEALAPGYLEFLDGISERVLEQIDLGLAAVNDSASDINDQVVGNLMPGYGETAPIWEQAAAQQLQAANTFANSTEAFAAAVQAFLNGTGPAPVAYAPTTTVNTSLTSAQVAALSYFLGREVNA